MDELVAEITAQTGIDPATAHKAAIAILGFLKSEGPPDKVQQLFDAIPGAQAALDEAGGAVGGGIMGVFNELSAAGLGMGKIQGVARAFGDVARAKVGEETLDAVVGAIPGLSQFV